MLATTAAVQALSSGTFTVVPQMFETHVASSRVPWQALGVSHTAALRKLGVSAEALGEVLAIVGLFNTTNSLADGYQVEPDVLPPVD